MQLNKIHNTNCLDGLKQLEDNSVHSIVTDPPYELGFMGKEWDKSGIAYNTELWNECLRVLKPGGYLLSFGGSRTYHRMACAIEDAGFEIRDQIMWIYGSGFPKSMDISKAITAKEKYGNAHSSSIRKARMGENYQPTGQKDWHKGMQFETPSNYQEMNTETELTDNAKQWEGWGTALKPAHEPIVVARKPLNEKTVAENVLKWGTGGINIDECRVEFSQNDDPRIGKGYSHNAKAGLEIGEHKDNASGQEQLLHNPQGRFPANIIFDEEAGQLLDEQTKDMRASKPSRTGGGWKGSGTFPIENVTPIKHEDSGGASRFFYCAKASKKERGEGNIHPTVKPIALMQYLVKLVTPPNGIVLDPFAGSGTTCLAATKENFQYIGIELDTTYCGIAEKRLLDIV